jgi:hypothetical protein
MKCRFRDTPRRYTCGRRNEVEIADCGSVELEPDEQLTFTTPAGAEYDLARKSFGFYATPSLNGRLARFHLRAVMVKNQQGLYFILLVEAGREADFEAYVASEELEVVCWLDSTERLEDLQRRLGEG